MQIGKNYRIDNNLVRELKIGDRVKCIKPFDGEGCLVGKTGTVLAIEDREKVGVGFDETFVYGHDLNGRCEDRYGYWGNKDCLMLINTNLSIINLLKKIQ